MSEFEKIWLIDTGEAARVWCDSPDPSNDLDAEDAVGPYILNADKRIAELDARRSETIAMCEQLQAEIEGHELMAEKNADRIAELVDEVFTLSAQLKAQCVKKTT